MADLVTFVPRADLDAQANMAGFIALCKTKLKVFGEALDFDSDRWDVSNAIELKAQDTDDVVFSNLETCGTRTPVMMLEPFKSFAKAYTRYQQAIRPTKIIGHRTRALRLLEAALREAGTSDPVRIDSHVLNRAAQLARSLSETTAYGAGNRLETIANYLDENRLTVVPTRWRNPIKPPERINRVGKEADERRMKKLPSEAALEALPKVFRLATEPADVVVSSVAAILCSAPDRVNEVLLLSVDCIVQQREPKTDTVAFGLRWWPAKGAKPMVKWIIPSMASIVVEAVSNIRALTDEARQVARWYEQNPGKLYLPTHLEHLRKQEWLSMVEINDILFSGPVHYTVARRWCTGNDVPFERRGKLIYARFADVETAVLKMLPRGFPIANKEIGLKYSDALCVVQRNTLESLKMPMRCVIEPVVYNQIRIRLGAGIEGVQSVFDRCGLSDPEGNPIRLRSQQLRHYLNTLAQAGGMSQLEIAKWSGRKDVRQNRGYDHETSDVIVARIRAAVGDDARMFGPLATRPRAALITRDEFARLKVPTAHTTDFGYCIHDYVMSPCQMHRDCLNCGEQVCVKSDSEKERRIRQAYAEVKRLLAMAEQAAADGELGASEWAEHHRGQVDRITALLDILDDPAVPRGAIIQLMPADIPSRLEHAAQARALPPAPVGGDPLPTVEGRA